MTITRHIIIRQVIEETGLINPKDIAEVVAERTPDDLIRGWYREAIIPDIRQEHLRRRKQSVNKKVAAAIATAEKTGRKLSAKTKADLVREAWQEKISAGVTLDGVWKRLADCSADEVSRLAEIRYEAAEQVREEGLRFEKLRAAMDEFGAVTPADLPAEVGVGLL